MRLAIETTAFDKSKLVAELGCEFERLIEFAIETNTLLGLLTAYKILGLSADRIAISNPIHDLRQSRGIIQSWMSPTARAVRDFYLELMNHPSVLNHYAPIPARGSAQQNKAQFGELKTRSFLLAMVTNPLTNSRTQTSPKHQFDELIQFRRLLRVWTFFQAAERYLKHGCALDQNISTLARFLILGPNDPHLASVDELLYGLHIRIGQPGASLDLVSAALLSEADSLLTLDQRPRHEVTFLNAIKNIASGDCLPIQTTTVSNSGVDQLIDLKKVVSAKPYDSFQIGEQTNLDVYPVTSDTDSDDETLQDSDAEESLELITLDQHKAAAEQIVESRAFFIQRSEYAHYLPWSWEQHLPTEIDPLLKWVNNILKSSDTAESLGAACAWLAIHTGRSLSFVLHFLITDQAHPEWSLSQNLDQLHRLPVRRRNSWVPKDEKSLSLIRPFADSMVLQLPPPLVRALSNAHQAAAFPAKQLSGLWSQISKTPIDTWFNHALPDELSRLSAAKLAGFLPALLFDRTGDSTLARILSSHPNSGLPGACSYATWDIQTIEKGLDQNLNPELPLQDKGQTQLIGSLLSPIEDHLIAKIQQASTQVQTFDQNEPLVEQHNLIAQYLVTALYAATGCRYLKDPFESLKHFNLDLGHVYINDKADAGLHEGRLVPLPDQAIQLMHEYVRHLQRLQSSVTNTCPEFAKALDQLTAQQQACDQPGAASSSALARLPLFFLLDERFNWHSLNQQDLPGVPLFEWGLPKNLFRHRYVQELTQLGVPVDIVNGWMGHAERGSATYSDVSPRCWLDDANQYRAAINTLFNRLGFIHPAKIQGRVSINPDTEAKKIFDRLEQKPFGERERRYRRKQAVQQAIRSAHREINLLLGNRGLHELEAEDIEKLIQRMLLRDGQVTYPYASIRLGVMMKRIDQSESAHKIKVRKRLVAIRQENSLIKKEAVDATSHLKELCRIASDIRASIKVDRLANKEALIVGCLLLCIEKRLSYRRLLNDVLAGKNFRIVQHQKHYYLEYSEELDPEDMTAPVQRHEISYKTASLLVKGRARLQDPKTEIPAQVQALAEYAAKQDAGINPSSLTSLLDWLYFTLEQANLVELPGLVAAALSERCPPTSLGLVDWLRQLEGTPRSFTQQATGVIQAQPNIQPTKLLAGRALKNNSDELKSQAKSFHKAIHQQLNDYKPSQAKAASKKIIQCCKQFEGSVSSSLLLLGHWTAHLMDKGKGRGTRKALAKNTLITYFGSLITAFEGLAYDRDLLALDEDEITDLYGKMIEFRITRHNQIGYFGDRLQQFHRFASNQGVSDPDWSELNLADDARRVRSGHLTEIDYLNSLEAIGILYTDPDQSLLMQFALLCCYRFGLRSREALGLRYKDWCTNQAMQWVLIRNNPLRTLKSDSSRRAIPLLFDLQETEQSIVDQVMARCIALGGTDKNTPIFCEIRQGRVQESAYTKLIPQALIQIIRQVTGNPALVLHHARHAFYNRVAPVLLGLDTPLAQTITQSLDKEALLECVLGQNTDISKRSSMALARLLGHYHPSTGMKNYCHLMTDWADQLTPVETARAKLLKGAFNTRSLKTYQAPKNSSAISLSFRAPELPLLLKTLRLVSVGKSFEQAGALMGLHPDHTQDLQTVFEIANNKMRFKDLGGWGHIAGKDHPNALLRHISDDAWVRMIGSAEQYDHSSAPLIQITLDDIPSLTGSKRHILMAENSHCLVVREAMQVFELKDEAISVTVYKNKSYAAQMLDFHGFKLKKEGTATQEKGFQLDTFDIYKEGRFKSNGKDYGGFKIERRNQGVLRNSHELAVAVLSVGFSMIAAQNTCNKQSAL